MGGARRTNPLTLGPRPRKTGGEEDAHLLNTLYREPGAPRLGRHQRIWGSNQQPRRRRCSVPLLLLGETRVCVVKLLLVSHHTFCSQIHLIVGASLQVRQIGDVRLSRGRAGIEAPPPGHTTSLQDGAGDRRQGLSATSLGAVFSSLFSESVRFGSVAPAGSGNFESVGRGISCGAPRVLTRIRTVRTWKNRFCAVVPGGTLWAGSVQSGRAASAAEDERSR